MSVQYGGDKITFADGSTVASGWSGFKNRIINGAMMIDQRNAGASVTPATSNTTYPVDRFVTYASQASKYTAQQNAGSVTPPTGFVNYLGFTSSSAYSIGASDYFLVGQRIEGLNFSDMGWGTAGASTVTLSFWVRSSLTGTFGGSIRNGSNNYSYPFTFVINSANTWEQKSITIAGPTSGTWATTNAQGPEVIFSLGTGSSLSGTAGVWNTTTAYLGATGAGSVVGTSGATFQITGVQLEKGSTATSFDYRPYGTELALCQRYYEAGSFQINGYVSGAGNLCGTAGFVVSKRTTPTVTAPKGGGANTGATITSVPYLNGTALYAAFAGTGEGYFSTNWTASAEL